MASGDKVLIASEAHVAAVVAENVTKAVIDTLDINAAEVNSLTVETAVPANAVFTDTVYDDSVIDCGTIT